MRAILAGIVQSIPTLRLVASAETAAEALAELDLHQPDLVILDLVLRTGSGVVVLREIKQRAPACRVVVFSTHDEEPYRVRCLAEKADFFFSKNHQHQELVRFLCTLGKDEPART